MSDIDKELAVQREEHDRRRKMLFYNSWRLDEKGISLLSFPYPDVLKDFVQKAHKKKLATKVLVLRTPDNKQHVFEDYGILLYLYIPDDRLAKVMGLRDFWRLRRHGEPAFLYKVEDGDISGSDHTRLRWVRYKGENYSIGSYERWADRQSFVKACAATLGRSRWFS